MKRLIIALIFIVCGCQTLSDKSRSALVYDVISKDNYESFKNWDVFIREGEDLFVFDYKKDERFARFIAQKIKKTVMIRAVMPIADSSFIPMNNYSEKTLLVFGVDRKAFFKNINICFKNGLESVSYREKLNGVIIKKDTLTYVNLFTADSRNGIPDAYVEINTLWYAAKTNR